LDMTWYLGFSWSIYWSFTLQVEIWKPFEATGAMCFEVLVCEV
jgi:hypothetical protein